MHWYTVAYCHFLSHVAKHTKLTTHWSSVPDLSELLFFTARHQLRVAFFLLGRTHCPLCPAFHPLIHSPTQNAGPLPLFLPSLTRQTTPTWNRKPLTLPYFLFTSLWEQAPTWGPLLGTECRSSVPAGHEPRARKGITPAQTFSMAASVILFISKPVTYVSPPLTFTI